MSYQLEWTYKNVTCVATGEITGRDAQQHLIDVTFTDLVFNGKWTDWMRVSTVLNAMPTKDPTASFSINATKQIQSIDVSNLDTSKILYLEHMFNGCEHLTSLDLSNLDISKAESLMGMFYNCKSLISLDFPALENSNVVASMCAMFNGCTSLQSLDISNWDTSKVTNMSQMFSGCTSLQDDVYLSVSSVLADYNAIINSGETKLYIFGDNSKVAEICKTYPNNVFPIPYPVINSCSLDRSDTEQTKVIFSLECTTTYNSKNAFDKLAITKSGVSQTFTTTTTTKSVVNDTTKYVITGSITEELPIAKAGEYSIKIVDTLGRTSESFVVVVPTDATVISVKENSGIAFGETCEDDGFTCAFDSIFKGTVTAEDTVTAGGNVSAKGIKLVYEKGDSYTIISSIHTAGYVTSSGASVRFMLPLDKPVASDVTKVTIDNLSLTLRQGGKYTHGSSSSTGATPKSVAATINPGFIMVNCTMSSTTNAVNNDTIGVSTYEGGKHPTITFS